MASSGAVNPGSVYQSYNASTGVTTYGAPPASYGALVSTNGVVNTASQAVATPANTPAGASVYQGGGVFAPSSATTNFTEVPNSQGTMINNSAFSQNPSQYPGIPMNNLGLTPSNKFASVSVPNTINSPTITNPPTEKATGIVNTAEKTTQAQTTAQTNVNNSLNNPAQLNSMANQAFVEGAIMGSTGKVATAQQIQQYVGQPVSAVAKAFGYTVPTTSGTPAGGTPGTPSGTPADPSISAPDNSGLIDLAKFQTQYMSDWQAICDKVSQDQTNLVNAQNQEASTVQGIGQQTGVEQGLLTGEEAAYKAQQDLAINTLTQMLGIDQQAKSDLTASGQFEMSIMNAANDLKQQAFQNAETLRSDQQSALTNFLSIAKESNMNPTKLTPDQMTWLSGMAQSTGIPMDTLVSTLKATFANNLLSTQQAQATLNKATKTTSSSSDSTGISKSDSTAIETALLAEKGSDGFVSPQDYAAAKQDWINRGGEPTAFDTKFKGRRNPDNPYYPVTGGSTGGQTSMSTNPNSQTA